MDGLYECFRKFIFVYLIKSITKETKTFEKRTCCPVFICCRVPLKSEIHSTFNMIFLLRLDNAVTYSGLKIDAKPLNNG